MVEVLRNQSITGVCINVESSGFDGIWSVDPNTK